MWLDGGNLFSLAAQGIVIGGERRGLSGEGGGSVFAGRHGFRGRSKGDCLGFFCQRGRGDLGSRCILVVDIDRAKRDRTKHHGKMDSICFSVEVLRVFMIQK